MKKGIAIVLFSVLTIGVTLFNIGANSDIIFGDTISKISRGSVSDTTYGSSWDGDTTNAPSKNTVYDKIEGLAGGHDAVTLGSDVGVIFGLTGQELTLDTQTANYVFAGPVSGVATDPTFRALVAGDIPDLSATYQVAGSYQVSNAVLTELTALTDPAADRVAFWNDTSNNFEFKDFANWDTAYSHSQDNSQAHSDYMLNSGDIATGVYDFGGADSFEIPNGAGGTTVDASGEISIDTTSKTLNFFDGAGEKVLNPIQSKAIIIESPVAGDDLEIWRADMAITLVEVTYLCTGGTNWVGQVQEYDANGANGADTQAADTTATAGTTSDVTSFSNTSIDAGDFVGIKTTSISGTPTRLNITFYYYENP